MRKRTTISEFETRIGGQRLRLFQALLSGVWMSRERLVFALYFDRIDDSPLDAFGVVDVKMCQLRKALKPHGIIIENKRTLGFRFDPASLKKARALINETTLPFTTCPHCGTAQLMA